MASARGSARRLFLGLDVGATKTLVLLTQGRQRVLGQQLLTTAARDGPEAVVQQLLSAIDRVLVRVEARRQDVAGVGVGFAGWCDLQGTVLAAPNMTGWRSVPLRAILEELTGVPVAVGNDANMAALAEARMGAGRGFRDLVYVTVSTGIGGGIVAGGRLLMGASGMAGEIGHLVVAPDGPRCGCGSHGCLEAMASGSAIAREAHQRLALAPGSRASPIAAQEVFEWARAGDRGAQEVITRASRFLGIGLRNVVNLLDPQAIVIGGGLSQQWKEYVEPALQVMRAAASGGDEREVQVLPAALGERSTALGAILWLQRVLRHTARS